MIVSSDNRLIKDIPSDWEAIKLKRVVKIVTGNTPPKSQENNYAEEGVPWVKPDNLTSDFVISNPKEKISEEGMKTARLIPEKSALVCCIGSVGKVSINTECCTTNQQINSIVFDQPELLDNEYGLYVTLAAKEEYIKHSNKVVVSILNKTDQGSIKIPKPPLSKQKIVAKFLKHKTFSIDTLISDKEKLIKLLEEKRQAIITEAVTKGLNPDVKMKDSGVEWIGEIPEHWGVEKYKNLVQRVKRSPKLDAEIITAFRDGIVTLRKNRREDGYTFAIKEHGYQQIKEGDLVVHQMDAFAGAIGISDSEGKASPVYTVCTPLDKNIQMSYLSWSLKVMSMGGYIQALAKGIRERSTDFRWNDMKGLLTCLPPYREQVEIERYIEDFIKENNGLITKLKEAIKLLKEYRQALIYEAVTGKIDVQEMVKETKQEEVSSS